MDLGNRFPETTVFLRHNRGSLIPVEGIGFRRLAHAGLMAPDDCDERFVCRNWCRISGDASDGRLVLRPYGVVVLAPQPGGVADPGVDRLLGDASPLEVVGAAAPHVYEELRPRRDASLRRPALVVAWSCAIGAFILECGYVLPSDEGSANPIAAIAVLAVGVLVAAVPAVTVFLGHLVRGTGIDQEHLSERTAQFVLIVLGETFLGLILNLHELNAIPNIPMFVLTFVIVYCMWSTYFSSVIPGGVPTTLGRVQLWLSAHVLFMIGAVGVSSALSALTLIPLSDRLPEVSSYRLPLPLFWMLLALAILTWLSRAAAKRLVWLHCGIAVIIVAMGVVGALWFPSDLVVVSLLASLLVVVDAVAAARMTQLNPWTAATSSP